MLPLFPPKLRAVTLRPAGLTQGLAGGLFYGSRNDRYRRPEMNGSRSDDFTALARRTAAVTSTDGLSIAVLTRRFAMAVIVLMSLISGAARVLVAHICFVIEEQSSR